MNKKKHDQLIIVSSSGSCDHHQDDSDEDSSSSEIAVNKKDKKESLDATTTTTTTTTTTNNNNNNNNNNNANSSDKNMLSFCWLPSFACCGSTTTTTCRPRRRRLHNVSSYQQRRLAAVSLACLVAALGQVILFCSNQQRYLLPRQQQQQHHDHDSHVDVDEPVVRLRQQRGDAEEERSVYSEDHAETLWSSSSSLSSNIGDSRTQTSENDGGDDDVDMVVIAYNSKPFVSKLLFDSIEQRRREEQEEEKERLLLPASRAEGGRTTTRITNSNNSTTNNASSSSSSSSSSSTSFRYKLISVGRKMHLWKKKRRRDELEPKRGWMFRFRLVLEALRREYLRRKGRDFVVLLSDAGDVYLSNTAGGATGGGNNTNATTTTTTTSSRLQRVKERFETDFAPYKIVFSTQIYCCNPWPLRSVARRDWDDYYRTTHHRYVRYTARGNGSNHNDTSTGGDADDDGAGYPETIYKHLNAGAFIGYASAILTMADEMRVWNTSYLREEAYVSRIQQQRQHDIDGNGNGNDGNASSSAPLPPVLHMHDFDVDDDEWQISAWYLQQAARIADEAEEAAAARITNSSSSSSPLASSSSSSSSSSSISTTSTTLAAIDVHQEIFSVTGTYRGVLRGPRKGFEHLSRQKFYETLGTLPKHFDERSMGSVPECPYAYHHNHRQASSNHNGSSSLAAESAPSSSSSSSSFYWTNQVTGSRPLVFHFAGDHWLCACHVFLREGYSPEHIPPKFAKNCRENYPAWYHRVNDGHATVANTSLTSAQQRVVLKPRCRHPTTATGAIAMKMCATDYGLLGKVACAAWFFVRSIVFNDYYDCE